MGIVCKHTVKERRDRGEKEKHEKRKKTDRRI